jgi:hypothetical protein
VIWLTLITGVLDFFIESGTPKVYTMTSYRYVLGYFLVIWYINRALGLASDKFITIFRITAAAVFIEVCLMFGTAGAENIDRGIILFKAVLLTGIISLASGLFALWQHRGDKSPADVKSIYQIK